MCIFIQDFLQMNLLYATEEIFANVPHGKNNVFKPAGTYFKLLTTLKVKKKKKSMNLEKWNNVWFGDGFT